MIQTGQPRLLKSPQNYRSGRGLRVAQWSGSARVSELEMTLPLRGYGMDTQRLIWNEPTDVKNGTKLMEYFGPEEKWWK